MIVQLFLKLGKLKKIYWSKLAKNNLKIKFYKNMIQKNSKSEWKINWNNSGFRKLHLFLSENFD